MLLYYHKSVYKTIELTCFAIEKQKIREVLENYTVEHG